jgi:alpha-ketoglutarate-dependent taurine dioxygenase
MAPKICIRTRSLVLTVKIVTRYIVSYKKEESDCFLKFLFDHIALSQDLQVRVKWTPGSVVVWDVSLSPRARSRWKGCH